MPASATDATEHNTAPHADRDSHFNRRSRLVEQTSFTRVFQGAERSRDKMFTVLYRPNGTTKPRLGLAIGKKNCRLATGRNRLKRIIRESFRHHQSDFPGLDIVVLNQPAAASANNSELFRSLQAHWHKCARQAPEAKEATKS